MEQDSSIRVKDIMNAPIGIESGTTLDKVIDKLLTHRISRLIIYKEKKPIGMVSEKDILNYLYQEKLHTHINKVPINEIMHDIFFITSSSTIPEAAKFMIENRCSSIAVGSEENLLGIVTKTDITKYYAQRYQGKNQVAKKMSVNYFSALANDSIYDLIGTMLDLEISRMAIIYKTQKPVGIISTGDIFRTVLDIEANETTKKMLNLSREYENFWTRYGEFCSQPAEKIMSRGIIQVKENEDLANACQMILDKGINALLVEDSEGRLVGIIGKREILSALADLT